MSTSLATALLPEPPKYARDYNPEEAGSLPCPFAGLVTMPAQAAALPDAERDATLLLLSG